MDRLQPDRKFEIRFPEADDADANIYARDLADFLNAEVISEEALQVEAKRSDRQTQDFGATLVLILGTAAVTAVAKGIQAWLKGHTGASMEILTEQGRVVLHNVESKSAAEIAKAFSGGNK